MQVYHKSPQINKQMIKFLFLKIKFGMFFIKTICREPPTAKGEQQSGAVPGGRRAVAWKGAVVPKPARVHLGSKFKVIVSRKSNAFLEEDCDDFVSACGIRVRFQNDRTVGIWSSGKGGARIVFLSNLLCFWNFFFHRSARKGCFEKESVGSLDVQPVLFLSKRNLGTSQ